MELIPLNIFLDSKIFQIPAYQRGFSWGKEQIDELLDDIEDLAYIAEHYGGTITLQYIKEETTDLGFFPRKVYDVVDGQQRMVTIQLLLSCIDIRCRKLRIPIPGIEDFYLENGQPKLRLNTDDRFFLLKVLSARTIKQVDDLEHKTFTEKNLKEAKKILLRRFSNKTEEQCKTLLRNLLDKFKVNQFIVNSQSQVGLVFETMNDRGLPLSDMDKVKNYLMYLCQRFGDDELALKVNQHFGKVFNELVKVEKCDYFRIEDHFLKNAYIIYTGDSSNLSNIHKKVKLNLITKYADDGKRDLFFSSHTQINRKRTQIRKFTEYLEQASTIYTQLKTCTCENDDINTALKRLAYLGYLDAFLPLLMAIRLKAFNDSWVCQIISILEVYAVRLFCIEQKDAKTGISQLKAMTYKTYNGELNYTNLRRNIRAFIKEHSDGYSLKRSIKNVSYYSEVSNHHFINYFLSGYESYLRKQANDDDWCFDAALLVDQSYTIEHIAPQQAQAGAVTVSKPHTLGNLVLTKDNARLGNALFTDKKAIYQNSDLRSERELIEYTAWNNQTINARAGALYEFAKHRWKI